jgi:hypothetical protein
MIMIAGYREYTHGRIEFRDSAAELSDIAPHRLRPREVIAGQEDHVGAITPDCANRQLKAAQVLVAINMEIAYLARDDTLEARRQSPHRQCDPNYIEVVYRSPPHAMERPQRDRRFALRA